MKKALVASVLLSLLPLLASAVNIRTLKAEQIVGTYKGIDGGGKECTIKIFKYEPWLPSAHESFIFEFQNKDLTANVVTPNKLDSNLLNYFYFESKVDDKNIFMDLNVDSRNSTEESPVLMGVTIETPSTPADEVCYLLKKQK